jgi:hypothetical protein
MRFVSTSHFSGVDTVQTWVSELITGDAARFGFFSLHSAKANAKLLHLSSGVTRIHKSQPANTRRTYAIDSYRANRSCRHPR